MKIVAKKYICEKCNGKGEVNGDSCEECKGMGAFWEALESHEQTQLLNQLLERVLMLESDLYYDLDQPTLAERCKESRMLDGVECTFMPQEYEEFEILDSNVMLMKPGSEQSHHCICGANVFSKIRWKSNGRIFFRCNACESFYVCPK